MGVILTALDDSPAAEPVLGTGERFGKLLDTPLRVLHIGNRLPARLHLAGVPVRLEGCGVADAGNVADVGGVVDALVAAGDQPDVIALVLGARSRTDDRRPLGRTALGVATGTGKPIVVVPPDADPHAGLDRVLVPLEGTARTSMAPQALIGLAPDATLDVVVLHVIEPHRLPSFTDQPQHEHPAWAREFLARYCPWEEGIVQLLTRVGCAEELIPLVAGETGRDLVLLGWSQRLPPGRARVVRAVLRRTRLPVVLVPLPPTVG